LQEWFIAIRNSEAGAYRSFSDEIVERGDCIITFNYDVSLDRELHIAGKWELGDGYGFDFDGFPCGSQTKLLKLHGSANWIALLFGGITSGITAVLDGSLGVRPVIAANELSSWATVDLRTPDSGGPGAASCPGFCLLATSVFSLRPASVASGRTFGILFGSRLGKVFGRRKQCLYWAIVLRRQTRELANCYSAACRLTRKSKSPADLPPIPLLGDSKTLGIKTRSVLGLHTSRNGLKECVVEANRRSLGCASLRSG